MGARQSNLMSKIGRPGGPGVSLTLSGGRELIRNFERLPVKMQRRVCRSAVAKVARKMVKVVKTTIETESPPAIDSGLLRKSIGFRPWTSKKGRWAVGATIGPRKGFATLVVRNKRGKLKALTKGAITKRVEAGDTFFRSQLADPVRYAHLVEGGVVRGKHGRVKARPFLEHSYLRNRDVMAGVLRTEIRKGLERETQKLFKRVAYGR